MKKKLFKDLKTSIGRARDMNKICSNCKRTIPNKEYKTKSGCIWCDTKNYWRKEMKEQFVIGVSVKTFIRVYDGDILIAASLTEEEAKFRQKMISNSKIYKLVEVKE